jgi:hypothetical protein
LLGLSEGLGGGRGILLELTGREEFREKGGLDPLRGALGVPNLPRRFTRLGKAARIALAWGLFIIAELLRIDAMA